MAPAPLAVCHFELDALAVAEDPGQLLSEALSLGPSLGLLEPPEWIAFVFGRFSALDDCMRPLPIRVVVAHADRKQARHSLAEALYDIFLNHAVALRTTGFAEDCPAWFKRIATAESTEVLDLSGFVPRLTPIGTRADTLWMSRFLTSLERMGPGNAGVALVLRPIGHSPDESPIVGLRRFFERTPVREHTLSTNRGDEKTRTNRGKSVTLRSFGTELRHRALQFLQEGARSGAWWASVRCFGESSTIARRVAALYWGCVSGCGSGTQTTAHEAGRFLSRYAPGSGSEARRHHGEAGFHDVWASLGSPATLLASSCDGDALDPAVAHAVVKSLARHGVLLDFDRPERALGKTSKEGTARRAQRLASVGLSLTVPGEREMLVTGERVSALFQLPAAPSPTMQVVRGFSYCFCAEPPHAEDRIEFADHCPGGLEATPGFSTGHSHRRATVVIDHLTRHVLVVGATGSGKTTTVAAMLACTKKMMPDVHITVLEGAKREYRETMQVLGIEADGLVDLMERYLPIHIFVHPPTVSPEAHVSQLASLLEATLEMPVPLPALMRDAIARAYSAFSSETSNVLRRQHPIRFWLTLAALEVLHEANYKGEIKGNIEAALRTRLRSLALGASGKVLSGVEGDMVLDWQAIERCFTQRSNLLELESIADRQSRALVMSLFVLYFRYALAGRPPDEKLRNILVLEEAHRIIGKPHPSCPDNSLDYFGNLLGEVRAKGCGIMISDQSPSRLIDDAMRNTNTKIIMRLVSGDDVRAAAVGAGLPQGAIEDIPRLRRGQAILVRPDVPPAIVKVDEPPARQGMPAPPMHVDMRRLQSELQCDLAASTIAFRYLHEVVLAQAAARGPAPIQVTGVREVVRANVPEDEKWHAVLGRAAEEVGCKCGQTEGGGVCSRHAKRILLAALALLFEGEGPVRAHTS